MAGILYDMMGRNAAYETVWEDESKWSKRGTEALAKHKTIDVQKDGNTPGSYGAIGEMGGRRTEMFSAQNVLTRHWSYCKRSVGGKGKTEALG